MLTEFEAERMFAWLHGLLDRLPEKDKTDIPHINFGSVFLRPPCDE